MVDLISRADAIEAVCDKCPISLKEKCEWKDNGHCSMKVALEALPPADAEWIPCSERLPNTNGIYIVTCRRSDGFECRNITDACYFDGSNTWHDDTRVNHGRKYLTDVLAWMPLPKPYREDGEE